MDPIGCPIVGKTRIHLCVSQFLLAVIVVNMFEQQWGEVAIGAVLACLYIGICHYIKKRKNEGK